MEVHFLEFKRPNGLRKLLILRDDSRDLDSTTQRSPTRQEKRHFFIWGIDTSSENLTGNKFAGCRQWKHLMIHHEVISSVSPGIVSVVTIFISILEIEV